MMDETRYKEPLHIERWLDTALKMEWQKYATTPVTQDMVADHMTAQASGYVAVGYSLIEQGLKAVLYVRGNEPPRTHDLSNLFAKLPTEDQDVLRAYYDDFRHTFSDMDSFPLTTLDEFLENLDGGENNRGSFDWRYFPTEVSRGASMPRVSIHVMHEVVFGCIHLIESIRKGDDKADRYTYSWRLRRKRLRIHDVWLEVRMNSPGWGQEDNRLEILWGPDYRGQYDYLVFKDGGIKQQCFGPLPNSEKFDLSMIDKREELKSFDPVEGLRSVGRIVSPSVKRQEAESHHIMY